MSQGIFIILTVIVGVALGAVLFWFLNRRRKETDGGAMLMLQEQLKEIRGTLDAKLGESTRLMQEQSGHTTRIIREITGELVRVGEGQKQIAGFADQLKNLQDVLQNPKQRGVLGEYYLEAVLKNVLPPK
ncbi:MAG: DNA recombination protein RmuC, partial [bacterium]|nr:DNA recombination protein RmuC [bacterium]